MVIASKTASKEVFYIEGKPVADIPINHVIADTGDNKYLLMQRFQGLQISHTWWRFFLKHLFVGRYTTERFD